MRWSKIKRRRDGSSPLRLIRYEACALRFAHGGRLFATVSSDHPAAIFCRGMASPMLRHRPCCSTDHDIPPKQAPYRQTFPAKRKAGGKPRFPPVKDTRSLFASGHGLDLLDLTAIVGTALRAHSVRQMQRTALGASHQTGSRQLPHGAASLVASLLGYFSLGYCHVDTSLVLTALSSNL